MLLQKDPPMRPPMRLPDFIIIGAAKAGTTSLYKQLSAHPGLFLSTPKEPEFFARDDRFAAGIDSYAKLFAGARPDQLCGEASTLYSLSPLFPQTAARMAAAVPGVKLIYMLREPVSRAYSYYVQLTKNYQNASRDYRVHRRFEECLFPERFPARAPREKFLASFDSHLPDLPELMLGGSRYADQIAAYLAHFSRDQILFVTFEEFLSDRAAVVGRICAFLGVDPAGIARAPAARANISADHFDKVGKVVATEDLKRRLGLAGRIGMLLPKGLRARVRDLLLGRRATPEGHQPPPMEPETEAWLKAEFHADLPGLAALTGLDLSAWQKAGAIRAD